MSRATLILFSALLAQTFVRAAGAGPSDLDAALDLRGARVAALVVRARDGEVLYARQADERLAPASNQKIFTALAALAAYGPTHRFSTTVLSSAPPDENGRVGDVWVRGGGDPALTSEEWWRLSADLRRSGLRAIAGDLLVDDSAFDAERWNAEWGAATTRAYYPAIGALMANYGSFTVEVRPGHKSGAPVAVAIDPPVAYLTVENKGSTGSTRNGNELVVDRLPSASGERVAVSGSLALGAPPQVVYRSVADPGLYAAAVLRLQLTANEISVAGNVRRAPTPPTAHVLLDYQGKPLGEIVRLLMKYSNNGIAEALCKGLGVQAMGGQGSWSAGLAALRRHLADAGIDTAALTLLDGSGLSPGNRVSPRALVAALKVAQESFAFGPDLIAALPIAGLDGTLQKRGAVASAKVRAKTGLLTGAVGLSGYAQLADGEQAIFSVLINDHEGGDADAMAAIDRFVDALVASRSRRNGAHSGS